MATVIVRSDADQTILMSERVLPIHLDSEHSAVQFLERLALAIEDSEAPRRAVHGDLQRRCDVVRRMAHR